MSKEPAKLEKPVTKKNVSQLTPNKPKEVEISTANADLLQPGRKPTKAGRADKDRQRILLTGVNSLVGHSLFQQMRNDDIMIKTGGKAHEFLGTLVQKDADFVPVPNDSIHILNAKT